MASIGKKISTKFKNRYRLVIRKDENLEEKVSLVLTPMNMLLVISALIGLFGTVIILMLSYTPLGNIMPTTATNFTQQERMELLNKIEELEKYQVQLTKQEESLRAILMGEGELPTGALTDEAPQAVATSVAEPFVPNPVDYSFYTPLKGVITDSFNVDRKHFAVDIASQKGEVVKAIQQGTVIYSAWNPKTGYTLIVQHANDFLSVYEHNAVLLKKEGTFVQPGDAVALVGNTGELTSGPHLHFELWNRGVALDPQKYIRF